MKSPFVYDKAKWHLETVLHEGYDEDQTFVHTGLYFGWLILHDYLAPNFRSALSDDELARFQAREVTGPQLFASFDGVLMDEMLTDEGNQFSRAYFDFDDGYYLSDYREAFSVGGGPEMLNVADNWENFDRIAEYIDRAISKWKSEQAGHDNP